MICKLGVSKIKTLSPVSLQPSKNPLNSSINMGFVHEGRNRLEISHKLVVLSNVIAKSSQELRLSSQGICH